MIKLGMPILYEFNSLEDNFKLAKDLGLYFVELNLNFGYCRKEMENGKVKELLDKYGLLATLHFYDETDMGSYDEVVEAYLKLLKKYVKYGKDYIKVMNFHNNPGPVVTISGIKNYIYEKEYDSYIVKLISNFNKVKHILDKYNIKMVIENVDSAKGASFLIKNYDYFIKEGFKLNYDIGHDYREGKGLYNYIQNHEVSFDEFHFHDASSKGCHLALGDGEMDLNYYKDLAVKNDAYVLLEVKSSDDLKKSIKYFK